MSNLIKYEAACSALAACKSVDEAKDWTDKAAAMQAYGRMAKNRTMEVDAAEIRIRAERRLGEMLSSQKAAGGRNTGARNAVAKQHPVCGAQILPACCASCRSGKSQQAAILGLQVPSGLYGRRR